MPTYDRAEELAETASEFEMPVRQFTNVYVIGGNDEYPDALDALRQHLVIAKKVHTIERINMQVVGDNVTPPIEKLVEFYLDAEKMAADAGIELFTETHVDRFTYDPRRLIAVHRQLLDLTNDRIGLRINADLSHYVHQIGNTHFPNWPSVASGELNLNALDPENFISRFIINGGLVGYGHLRMAVPNNLPRGRGSIQYPVVDPQKDKETSDLPNGGLDLPWEMEKTKCWWAWYRELFKFQINQRERSVVRFSTEFIGDGRPSEYRVYPYRNLFQNIAMVSLAQRLVEEIQAAKASE
jgi:hypothetical protein